MTAVYPVRMKMVLDKMVELSAMMKRPMCPKSFNNPGHPVDKSVKMGNVANLNIGPSYQISVWVVNIVHIAIQRVKVEMRVFNRVAE